MVAPPPLDSLLKTVQKFGLLENKGFSKSLGQNFLLDFNVTQKIVRCSPSLTNKIVVEVGPGPGGLTRAILEQNPKVLHVIEMDPKAILVMEELQKHYPNLIIHHEDALKIDFKNFVCDKGQKITILSNLPYHIGTALLTKWFDIINSIESMTLMFQKEVADRIIANPHSKEYGRLSIISQYLCMIDHGFDLSPHLFTPPPKVFSSVLTFYPKSDVDLSLCENLQKITEKAFSQRRKM
ncbi:MAG: ribosomal RNA small subunit methyltransferase A, partial [Proteobacteria bacterium]|nr:ribosomal RNA small subunit methyltransferase A [Pseudomonadota bacterium]